MNTVARLIATVPPDTPATIMVGDLVAWEQEIRAAERERLAAILERRYKPPQDWCEVAGAIRSQVLRS